MVHYTLMNLSNSSKAQVRGERVEPVRISCSQIKDTALSYFEKESTWSLPKFQIFVKSLNQVYSSLIFHPICYHIITLHPLTPHAGKHQAQSALTWVDMQQPRQWGHMPRLAIWTIGVLSDAMLFFSAANLEHDGGPCLNTGSQWIWLFSIGLPSLKMNRLFTHCYRVWATRNIISHKCVF